MLLKIYNLPFFVMAFLISTFILFIVYRKKTMLILKEYPEFYTEYATETIAPIMLNIHGRTIVTTCFYFIIYYNIFLK